MKTLVSVAVMALCIAGCSKPAATVGTPASSAAAPETPVAEPSVAAPVSFTIDDLTDADNDIMGCTTMLDRTDGKQGQVFIEDGVDTGAKGYIRIDGVRLSVDLTTSARSDTGAVRTFTDKAKTVTVVETTKTGASHQESDSVEQSGTITVTTRGVTQTLKVTGGTAC